MDRIFAATRKGLFSIRRRASGWNIDGTAFLGDNVSLVMCDPRDGCIYAALDHGHFGVKLHRSRDGGVTFEECAKPSFPEKPEGAEPEKDGMGKVLPWNVERVWALAPGHASEPGVLYCGTIPGAFFRSADGGDTWELNRALWDHPGRKRWFGGGADYPGIHSVLVDPKNPQRLVLGVSCGGVWTSEDAGASWRCTAHGMRAAFMPEEMAGDPEIQDPHSVVQCAAAPEVFWSQHHNGIFKSTDGAASWTEVEATPSSFGFAVAVHPKDPNTAWFVPAVKDEKRFPVDGKVVVSRTRDGGRSFEVLTQGLPQEHAYDLTYRHAFDIDASGDGLVFGSTTGSLWVSDDAGDSWLSISQHLPPIYAVRCV